MKPLDKSTWGKLFSSGEIRPQPWIHIKFSTILDEIMSWAALYLLRRIILTESMTVEFIKPVIIGETMEAGGGVLELKGRRDAIIEGVITNSAEQVCARSTGIFKTFSPAVAQRLKIADDAMLKWFESLFGSR